MTPDTRNTRVVVALVAWMTLGAATLLWLMPQPARVPEFASAETLLAATQGVSISDVTIEYAGPDDLREARDYDAIVFPDERPLSWTPRSPHMRLLVVGSKSDEIDPRQARSLIALLSAVRQFHRVDWGLVHLQPESDPRVYPGLPAQAHSLCDLLVRKAIIQ